MDLEEEEQECIGTVQIRIHNDRGVSGSSKDDDDGAMTMGLAALYRTSNDDKNDVDVDVEIDNDSFANISRDAPPPAPSPQTNKSLMLWVTNGTASYQTKRIRPSSSSSSSSSSNDLKMSLQHIREMGYRTMMDCFIGIILQQRYGASGSGNSNGQNCNSGGNVGDMSSQSLPSLPSSQMSTTAHGSQRDSASLLPTPPRTWVEFTCRRRTNNSDDDNDDDDDSNANNSTMEMIMKHARGNIVRVVAKHTLHQVYYDHAGAIENPNQSTNENNHHHRHPLLPPSCLPFLQPIVLSLQQTTTHLQNMTQQYKRTHRSMTQWKNTATKLSIEHWEEERNDMMDHFFTLFQHVQGNMRTMKHELNAEQKKNEKLERKVQRLQDQLENECSGTGTGTGIGGGGGGSPTRRRPRTLMVDHIDEHDAESFQECDVDALARGTRLDGGKNTLMDEKKNKNKNKKRKDRTTAKTASTTTTTTTVSSTTVSSNKRSRTNTGTSSTASTNTLAKGRAAARLEERKRKRSQYHHHHHHHSVHSNLKRQIGDPRYNGGGETNHDQQDDRKMPAKKPEELSKSATIGVDRKKDNGGIGSSSSSGNGGVPLLPTRHCHDDPNITLSQSQTSQSSMRRKNQYTGSIELWGTSAIFSDDDDDEDEDDDDKSQELICEK